MATFKQIIATLKKGPIAAGHAAELAALPDVEPFYAAVRKVKTIALMPLEAAVDAARVMIKADVGPHADLRRLGIERRGGLFEPDVMRRLVTLLRDDKPALNDLLAFWRTSGVRNLREIETTIQREAKTSDTLPGEGEMITSLKRMGLQRRGELFAGRPGLVGQSMVGGQQHRPRIARLLAVGEGQQSAGN